MEDFSPVSALVGGSLIGLSAAMLLYSNGKVAGVSGILFGMLSPTRGDTLWRLAFVAGLIGGAGLFGVITGDVVTVSVTSSWPLLVAGGLLVGAGTQTGQGCTSGHGVCGIGRLSRRSMVATVTFMSAAALTVFVVRHIIGG